jgi:hypothetical protein
LFHSVPSFADHEPMVYWDTARQPEYTEIVAAAEAAGVRIVTMLSRQLEEDLIEGALARLDVLSPTAARLRNPGAFSSGRAKPLQTQKLVTFASLIPSGPLDSPDRSHAGFRPSLGRVRNDGPLGVWR